MKTQLSKRKEGNTRNRDCFSIRVVVTLLNGQVITIRAHPADTIHTILADVWRETRSHVPFVSYGIAYGLADAEYVLGTDILLAHILDRIVRRTLRLREVAAQKYVTSPHFNSITLTAHDPIDMCDTTDACMLPCGHLFGTSGIARWYRESHDKNCPVCRAPIPEYWGHVTSPVLRRIKAKFLGHLCDHCATSFHATKCPRCDTVATSSVRLTRKFIAPVHWYISLAPSHSTLRCIVESDESLDCGCVMNYPILAKYGDSIYHVKSMQDAGKPLWDCDILMCPTMSLTL